MPQIWHKNHKQAKLKAHTPSKMTSRCSRTRTQKQNTCMQNTFLPPAAPHQANLQAPTTNLAPKTSKFNYPNIPTPTKETKPPTNFQKLNSTPNASQTAELNCLNFKLAVPPHK